ncbi:FAD-dependent oxidoreductase [Gluconacetobacter sacchari]|uniref:NAD(P)-binding protein n=1 Tax=Gluconacetobacter sacchari TaxID=92759 RepID=A0A7W4IGH2_9PROT|nr:FAD-dependent oxidoreductase [Gluconacetobacter sacchari]MBB2162436.1 NAD(P)-binding protein [Gluconacetobacter sacchari]
MTKISSFQSYDKRTLQPSPWSGLPRNDTSRIYSKSDLLGSGLTMQHFDFVIIGAGPAGLAARQRLEDEGCSVALIDAGKPLSQRSRGNEKELATGYGGAGLFSDGKFSFFPSATRLWQLGHQDALRASYDWVQALLKQHGLDSPPYPEIGLSDAAAQGRWALKEYPSSYLPLSSRFELITSLLAGSQSVSFDETIVEDLNFSRESQLFGVRLVQTHGIRSVITARYVIVATGRFGPLSFPGLFLNKHFQRLEVGFRIEQPSDRAFFANVKQLDPKFCFRDDAKALEWRTFCVCREGTTALAHVNGLWAVSGHSDCAPTCNSNVGFNTRILDEAVASRNLPHLTGAMKDKGCHFKVPLRDVLAHKKSTLDIFHRVYGPELSESMIVGLRHLIAQFPSIDHETTNLIGPTLEGVGWYPVLDDYLSLRDVPAWVAGDACGLFRGIVAALISGHYSASEALRKFKLEETIAA